MNSSEHPKINHDLTWLIILFFLVVYAFFIHTRQYSTNDASRMASIESLVHRGTWVIDDSPFAHTLDKIQVNGRFYSDKPPVLSFMGAGVYAALHHGLGMTLQSQGCTPDSSPTHCLALLEQAEADWAYFTLTLLLIALPGALMWGFAYRLARRNQFANWAALALVVAMGLGTAVFPFTAVFINHVPAAAALFAAFYILLTHLQPERRHLAWVGFLAAIAVTFDLSAGVFSAGLLFYGIWSYRRQAIWIIAGGLTPVLLMMVLDFQIMGNILPPQMYAEGYAYGGSALYANISGFSGSDNPLAYAFQLFVGDNGFLAFYPLILWYVVALIITIRSHCQPTHGLAIVTAISTTFYILYFVLSTNNFGGFAYSPRWMLIPVPLLAMYSLLDPKMYIPSWRGGLVTILALISIAGTMRGVLNPWNSAYPLFRLTYAAPEPRQYVSAVLSGYNGFEAIDADLQRSFGVDRVVRRWVDARQGMIVPNEEAWWFIHESTPIAPEWASVLGLPNTVPFNLHTNVSAHAQQWVNDADHTAYRSSDLFPVEEENITAISLPITFVGEDGNFSLQGYQWQQNNDELTLMTAWKVETRSLNLPAPRRAFIHILNSDGAVVAQSDLLAADYGALFPDDMLFQTQHISLTTLPDGRYWVQIGLYNPDIGDRILTDTGEDRILLRSLLR